MKEKGFNWLVIGGCPRSGTTALLDCLNHHNNIGLIPEYNFFKVIDDFEKIFYKEENSRKKLWIENINSNKRDEKAKVLLKDFLQFIPQKEKHLKPLIHSLFQHVFSEKKDLKVIGEKLPLYFKQPQDKLNKALSNIKYIHLFRNPLWVMNSFQHRTNLTKQKKDLWKHNDLNKSMDLWLESIRFYRQNKNKLEILPLKYEDFFVNPDITYKKIFDFIEVENFNIPYFSGEKYGKLNALDQSQKQIINKKLEKFIQNWDKTDIQTLID